MMKIKKKILALTITLAMVLALIPLLPPQVVARAATVDAGTEAELEGYLEDTTKNDITLTAPITLSGSIILGESHDIYMNENDLTISGSITGNRYLYLRGEGNLIITGTVTLGASFTIRHFEKGNITINGGSVNARGISFNDGSLFINGGTVIIGGSGIYVGGSVLIEGNSTVKVIEGGLEGPAISADDTVTINNGNVELRYGVSGIEAGGNVIINGGNLTLTDNEWGISAGGTVTITGGTVDSTSESSAIFAKSIFINGGTGKLRTTDDAYVVTATAASTLSVGSGVDVWQLGDLTVSATPKWDTWTIPWFDISAYDDIYDYWTFTDPSGNPLKAIQFGPTPTPTPEPTPTPTPAPAAPVVTEDTTPVSPKTGDPGSSLLYVLIALGAGGATLTGIKAVIKNRKK